MRVAELLNIFPLPVFGSQEETRFLLFCYSQRCFRKGFCSSDPDFINAQGSAVGFYRIRIYHRVLMTQLCMVISEEFRAGRIQDTR